MARAAAAMPPAARAGHWARARSLFMPTAGPGSQERLLGRVALEWASLAPAPATDRLFELAPAAWVVVQAAGADPLCAALCEASPGPCLWLDTDAAGPFTHAEAFAAPALAICDGFEDEAQSAAAQVLAHLAAGELPVALIAQDRVLVRRVRALLERRKVAMADETGWKLSTTRAAVPVVGLLQASRSDASTDVLLDLLKAIAALDGASGRAGQVDALEAICRERQIRRVAGLAVARLDPPLAAWWADVQARLAVLPSAPRRALPAWLSALAATLRACGAWPGLVADEAGRQVLAALRLTGPALAFTSPSPMSFDDFGAWVRDVLEQETFRPIAPANPAVVITPAARAVLRPFAAVVFPGADDVHLGGDIALQPLLTDTEAAALGIPTTQQRRDAERQAFLHVLAAPRVTLLRRRLDGAAPLGESALVERLRAALMRSGRDLAAWRDPRCVRAWPATPIALPAPSAPALLPERLSASGVEALRACPYRFFALNMLHLRERDELDDEIEKRDYGNWLHAVLHRFHQGRDDAGDPADGDLQRLLATAREVEAEFGLAPADFLPFAASFAQLRAALSGLAASARCGGRAVAAWGTSHPHRARRVRRHRARRHHRPRRCRAHHARRRARTDRLQDGQR